MRDGFLMEEAVSSRRLLQYSYKYVLKDPRARTCLGTAYTASISSELENEGSVRAAHRDDMLVIPIRVPVVQHNYYWEENVHSELE